VVFELLTGHRAFGGEDVSDTLAFILTREPDWATLPADTPPPIRRLLRRCLAKDRTRRLDSAADARLEIDEALTAPSVVDGATAPPWHAPLSAGSRALTWTLAASTLGLAVVSVLLWAPWRADKPRRSSLGAAGRRFGRGCVVARPQLRRAERRHRPRWHTAGSTPRKLFTRRLDQPKATELPGTQGATAPFFSPDGQWVGFAAAGKVNKISVEGGAVVPLGDNRAVAGASWGEDGSILVSEALGKGWSAGASPPVSPDVERE
jgi:serine/threonine-protein kinase